MFKFIILSLATALVQGASSIQGVKTNFTLSQTSTNTSSSLVILELWSETLAAPSNAVQQRLNGKIYLINQDIYGQNPIGKLNYFIDIGLHNKSDERLVNSIEGPVYMTDRDWITLKFALYDKDSVGNWSCIDGYSNYTATPRYDLTDYYPNNKDAS